LLELEPALDAVFAISDLAAVGVMMECRRRNIAIPSDLAVIGFGDFDIAAQMVPPLTTISVDFEDMGRRTGELLLAVLRGERQDPGARVANVGMRLCKRETTGSASR
jgi:LacI family gluconate utilization system Gnt-I transcriptional repressor